MSLRQAAEVLGVNHQTVANDLSKESLSNEKLDTRTTAQRVNARQVYLPTDVTVAARGLPTSFMAITGIRQKWVGLGVAALVQVDNVNLLCPRATMLCRCGMRRHLASSD